MFIVLEGLDRTGKSTVAESYRSKGFEVVHLSAPDKKYSTAGYAGPSYLDEVVELLMKYDGKDVVWDRSWYGEQVWPKVYNRPAQLSDEDMDVIKEFEDSNQTKRILMIDPDTKAHWKRCVDNHEPLDSRQFEYARQLYSKMAHQHNFSVLSLPEFLGTNEKLEKTAVTAPPAPVVTVANSDTSINSSVAVSSKNKMSPEQEKLEKANAINSILKMKRLFKQQGWPYDDLEGQVRGFLNNQLGNLLGSTKDQLLSKEDILIVKEFVKRLKDKQGAK